MPLRFIGFETSPEVQGRIAGLVRGITDERLDRSWKLVEVLVHAPVPVETAVESLHGVWNPDHVPRMEAPEGLPRLPSGTPCPRGCWRVEVNYVSRRSGGMGSYHQFDGYFVSLVLSPDLGHVLDARMEKAY